MSPPRWVDVSVPLSTGMVTWPGDPPVRISRVFDLSRGDPANVSSLSLGAHTGTHMDAPLHFLRGGKGVNRLPLTVAVGRARVIPIGDPEAIHEDELRRHRPRRGERLLFKTRNSPLAWKAKRFAKGFVHLTAGAARYLAARKVALVGVDYLSVGGYLAKDGAEVHRALLSAGVWIVEGLDLTRVPPGPCELVCLPLKIDGADGAPARAIVRPLGRKERSHG